MQSVAVCLVLTKYGVNAGQKNVNKYGKFQYKGNSDVQVEKYRELSFPILYKTYDLI